MKAQFVLFALLIVTCFTTETEEVISKIHKVKYIYFSNSLD